MRSLINQRDTYFWFALEQERFEGDELEYYLDMAIEVEEDIIKGVPYEKKVIDFEEMSSKYDAIFLTQKGLDEIQNSSDCHFDTWDIPSLLVLNFDAIASQQAL